MSLLKKILFGPLPPKDPVHWLMVLIKIEVVYFILFKIGETLYLLFCKLILKTPLDWIIIVQGLALILLGYLAYRRMNVYQEKRKIGRSIIVSLIILFFLPVYWSGAWGKVVDAETGEPISGVVAVCSWSGSIPNAAGGSTYCIDARETVTNEEGHFKVPGIFSGLVSGAGVGSKRLILYQVGYKSTSVSWEFRKSEHRIRWEDGLPVFPLEKMSKTRRTEYGGKPGFSGCERKDARRMKAFAVTR
jgi:hypothetical protein